MKAFIGILLAIAVLTGLWLYSSSPKSSSSSISSGEETSEMKNCLNTVQKSLEEYASIIDQVKKQTQTYGDDYDSLYSTVEEIDRIVDIGDPYSATFNCSSNF